MRVKADNDAKMDKEQKIELDYKNIYEMLKEDELKKSLQLYKYLNAY